MCTSGAERVRLSKTWLPAILGTRTSSSEQEEFGAWKDSSFSRQSLQRNALSNESCKQQAHVHTGVNDTYRDALPPCFEWLCTTLQKLTTRKTASQHACNSTCSVEQ